MVNQKPYFYILFTWTLHKSICIIILWNSVKDTVHYVELNRSAEWISTNIVSWIGYMHWFILEIKPPIVWKLYLHNYVDLYSNGFYQPFQVQKEQTLDELARQSTLSLDLKEIRIKLWIFMEFWPSLLVVWGLSV